MNPIFNSMYQAAVKFKALIVAMLFGVLMLAAPSAFADPNQQQQQNQQQQNQQQQNQQQQNQQQQNQGDGSGGNRGSMRAELVRLRRENEALKAKVGSGNGGGGPDPKDDDLVGRARRDRERAEETAKETKQIEKALSFNLGLSNFLKDNTELLPSEVGEIVKLAEKEKYDNAKVKAAAIQSSLIQSYFAVQANFDALTTPQKATIEEYLKLTKSGKEARAPEVFENIFEPAIETARKIRKAQEVGRSRSGLANPTAGNTAYKDRLVAISRKTHLGEKEQRV